MNKYKLYDNIIKATYINIATNDNIYFNNFNNELFSHKVFLKVAFMVANFENKKIYLNCSFFDFLKILWQNYSIKELIMGKCRLRFIGRQGHEGIDIDNIATFEAEAFENTLDIFEQIWNEYYKK